MRSLDPKQIAKLARLVLGEDASKDVAARLADRSSGDVEYLLIDLLAIVQQGGPQPDALRNGARRPPVLRCEGDYWTVSFAGRTVRLRDQRGLRYLAPLLERPREHVHVLELVRLCGGRTNGIDRARQTVTKGIALALAKIDACHPALATHLRTSVRRGIRCVYLPVWDE